MKKAKKNKLDVSRAGGYYIGANGKPHDAEGRPIGATAPKPASAPEPQQSPDKKGALPADFPGRVALADAGVDTWEALRSVAGVLPETDGLDAPTIEAIRAELAE